GCKELRWCDGFTRYCKYLMDHPACRGLSYLKAILNPSLVLLSSASREARLCSKL
ncbi:hypothetical protein AVEN_36235-1, partial [Araneus ventricosus]